MRKKLWNVSSVLLIGLLAVTAMLVAGVRLFGILPFTVISGSMEPAYPTGSLIYVKPVQAQEIRVGDPITFRLEGGQAVATHRVISIDEENGCFQTKGDANDAADGQPVYYNQLIGTPIFSIPALGYVASFIAAPPGLYIALAGAVIIIVLTLLPGMYRAAQKRDEADDKAHKHADIKKLKAAKPRMAYITTAGESLQKGKE